MKKKIYIAYTGGTIGMQRSQHGYIPQPGFMADCLAGMPEAAGHLLPSSTVHHRVLWLHWQEDAEAGKKRRGALMLCRDQCGAEAWRCLQVYLRLEVVVALARPAVPDALG